jgi:hypothetical protein
MSLLSFKSDHLFGGHFSNNKSKEKNFEKSPLVGKITLKKEWMQEKTGY